LAEVQRDHPQAIHLLISVLDKLSEPSRLALLENIWKVVNEWQKCPAGGMVTERSDARPVSERDVLTDAAQLLRCSKAHLCNVLNGKVPSLPPMPHVSLGRRKLIRRAALQRWLEQLEESKG
jgi:hypothetical protein